MEFERGRLRCLHARRYGTVVQIPGQSFAAAGIVAQAPTGDGKLAQGRRSQRRRGPLPHRTGKDVDGTGGLPLLDRRGGIPRRQRRVVVHREMQAAVGELPRHTESGEVRRILREYARRREAERHAVDAQEDHHERGAEIRQETRPLHLVIVKGGR